ncbi:MAG TPA: hypothetical protein VN920_03765 [Pyrinomonadaceae bacterium]|nr:hypothetical protein [Pyrinomonadaceae bacterium]
MIKRSLISLLTLLFLLPLAAYAQAANSRLSAKQIAKAEHLVSQLDQLDALINSGPDTAQYKTRIVKLSDGFNRAVASLLEGDEKTDIATALYWYEQLALNLNHPSAARSGSASVEGRCGDERPGVYQRLCESTSGSARDLLWAKARLHMNWARAGIVFQKTGNVDRPLDDIAVERRIDQMLAARLIESLKVLESEVFIYHSLGDFETSGKLARVPLAVFKRDLERISADAERTLSWLPQNMLKSELSNALHSFQDGAFWWEQIDQPRVVKVSELAFKNLDRSPSDVALLTTVPYTIAINWRHGSKYLKRAEQMMNGQA